ncbi:MAG: hypothetical protein ACJAR2_004031, partial [Ilumatobacter sp.]
MSLLGLSAPEDIEVAGDVEYLEGSADTHAE